MRSAATLSALESMKNTSQTQNQYAQQKPAESNLSNPFPATFWSHRTAMDLVVTTAGLLTLLILFSLISL